MLLSRSSAGLLAAVALASVAAAECDRQQLIDTADIYIAAQQSGNIDDLAALFSDDFSFRQNNKDSDIKAGILGEGLKLDHNRTTADTTACVSFTELISTAGPYVIGAQITHTADGAGISKIDVIAATTGDWGFNVAATLRYVQPEDWGTLEDSQRSARDVLKAAGDAYLDMWSDSTAIERVPWGSPCARTEGGMHATPDCRAGAPSGGGASVKITDRRYVIDETVGSCNIMCAFGSLPDSHEFRLVDGKVVLVHTITV